MEVKDYEQASLNERMWKAHIKSCPICLSAKPTPLSSLSKNLCKYGQKFRTEYKRAMPNGSKVHE